MGPRILNFPAQPFRSQRRSSGQLTFLTLASVSMSLAISFVNQFLSKRETRPRYCTSQNTSGLNVKLWGPLGVVISLNLIDGVGVTCYIFTGSQFPVWRSGPPLPAAECVPRKVRGSRKAHNPFRQLSTLSDFIAFSLPSAQSPQPISTTKHPQPPQRPSVPASLARKVRNLLSATSLPHPPALSAQRPAPSASTACRVRNP